MTDKDFLHDVALRAETSKLCFSDGRPDVAIAARQYHKDVTRLLAQLEQSLSERAALVEALRKLKCEAAGFLAMASLEAHGRTNMRVLRDRVDAASIALTDTAAHAQERDKRLQRQAIIAGLKAWDLLPPEESHDDTLYGFLRRRADAIAADPQSRKTSTREDQRH
jgi:hypothetical protein